MRNNNIEIMEKSSTCMSKAHSSSPEEEEGEGEEESGWTFYFEDFLCNTTTAANDNIDQQHPSFNSFSKPSPSQVLSDAACSPKKLMTDSNDHRSFSSINSKKLGSFKKRRSSTSNYKAAAALVVDDALEDTATSPANSPKVCHLNQQLITYRKPKEFTYISEKGTGTTSTGQTIDENTTELKKMGLCLVPISTFANYLGYN